MLQRISITFHSSRPLKKRAAPAGRRRAALVRFFRHDTRLVEGRVTLYFPPRVEGESPQLTLYKIATSTSLTMMYPVPTIAPPNTARAITTSTVRFTPQPPAPVASWLNAIPNTSGIHTPSNTPQVHSHLTASYAQTSSPPVCPGSVSSHCTVGGCVPRLFSPTNPPPRPLRRCSASPLKKPHSHRTLQAGRWLLLLLAWDGDLGLLECTR